MSNNAGRTTDVSYCLKLYFHVIRKSNGSEGQSDNSVRQAYDILQNDYNPHDIYFTWDYAIDYIDADSYYYYPQEPNQAVFDVNNHTDGIDIYLFDDTSQPIGIANGIGISSELLVSGRFVTSHIISHEVGHVLFLYHTNRWTDGIKEGEEETGDMPCKEHVNGDNRYTCGDLVWDTPADPNMDKQIDSSCNWTGSGQDENGDSYNPDEQNIMSNSITSCMEYFSDGQGGRMRNAIADLDYLQNVISSEAPNANNISIISKTSYVIIDQTWTRISANYAGTSSERYHWEWNVPSCYVKYGPNKSYIDVRPYPRMGQPSTINYTINIKAKVIDDCGNTSDWYVKPFQVRASSPLPPGEDEIFGY